MFLKIAKKFVCKKKKQSSISREKWFFFEMKHPLISTLFEISFLPKLNIINIMKCFQQKSFHFCFVFLKI